MESAPGGSPSNITQSLERGEAGPAYQAFEQAICNILAGQSLSESNEYLLQYIETELAWQASFSLFDSVRPDKRYFAANIILTKLNRHWGQLNAMQHTEMFEYLMRYLETTRPGMGSFDDRPFMNRVILCLACVSCHTVGVTSPGGTGASMRLAQYVRTAIQKIDCTPPELQVILVGLEMLCELPAQVDSLDGSREKDELSEGLRDAGTIVLGKIKQIAESALWSSDGRLHALSVKALRCWQRPTGLTLSRLYEEQRPSLLMVCATLQTGDGECIKQGCAALEEVGNVDEYPRPHSRDQAALAVLQHITAHAALLVPFFSVEEGDEDVAHAICSALVALASKEAILVSSPQYCSAELFQLLLSCAGLRPRRIAAVTFDMWVAIQDIPVAERHPFAQQEVFRVLLQTLLNQCAYPADYNGRWDESADDEDDFSDFRLNNGLSEVVLVCGYALDSSFFDELYAKISACTTLNGETLELVDWRRLEAALHVLHSAMEAVVAQVKSEASHLHALDFLMRTVTLILSPQMQGACCAHAELLNTLCVVLGSLTFVLTASQKDSDLPGYAEKLRMGEMFIPTLSFLFGALPNRLSCENAAKAINRLCAHGQASLTQINAVDSAPLICVLVDATVSVLEKSLDDLPILTGDDEEDAMVRSLLLVIEGVVRTLVSDGFGQTQALPVVVASIGKFGVQIQRCLVAELQRREDGVSHRRAVKLLRYAGQVIRYADMPADDEGSHILSGFLTSLWPCLQQLEADYFFSGSTDIVSRLMDLYGHALMSSGTLILSEVPNISATIVRVFQQQKAGATSAMQCATAVVEALAGTATPDTNSILTHLLQQVVQALSEHIAAVAAKNAVDLKGSYDPDCIEKSFRFLDAYMVNCPQILADSAALPDLGQLCLVCMGVCNEKAPLRMIMQVVQHLFYPSFQRITLAQHGKILQAAVVHGYALTFQLMSFVAGVQGAASDLRPNVLETLYNVISGCHPDYTHDCRMWVQRAMHEIWPFGKLNDAEKAFVLEKLFMLAGGTRKEFKDLCLAVCKICAGERGVECLQEFTSE